MQKITLFLLINGRAKMAMNFYTSVFKNFEGRGHGASGEQRAAVWRHRSSPTANGFMLLNTGPKAEFSAGGVVHHQLRNPGRGRPSCEDALVDGGDAAALRLAEGQARRALAGDPHGAPSLSPGQGQRRSRSASWKR